MQVPTPPVEQGDREEQGTSESVSVLRSSKSIRPTEGRNRSNRSVGPQTRSRTVSKLVSIIVK